MRSGGKPALRHQQGMELRQVEEWHAREKMMLDVVVDILGCYQQTPKDADPHGARVPVGVRFAAEREMLGDTADAHNKYEPGEIRHHPIEQNGFPCARPRDDRKRREVVGVPSVDE